ncbi:hypothetical protein FVER53590_03196 [Fusarium verticillioides]|uniref:Uncharacterized protein n=1 Tax=Gibberella moniliformis TaxID=117187 RepID=A0A172WC33_GIBMO|nr:hypothetical protein FVEG_03196 [Fusarium verticillioides]RBQ66089.1 hypothetical protein FVER14953_03196 [Fusarium verticillioides]RBQ98903.1 hypothetical protein FVER53263_03196 [Fusarium verticillioides]RBR15073.1 hypothetical protein FVER53590_03196 [Fusarium verticillioides]
MFDRVSIIKGNDLVPTNDTFSKTSLPKTNPLEHQTVTAPSLPSSQSEDINMGPNYGNLPLGLRPSVVVPPEDVPPGHVRLLGGFMCPSDPVVDLTQPKEEPKGGGGSETSVYHCPSGILEPEDADEFPGEHFPDDERSLNILSPIGPKRPKLYLRDNRLPVAPVGPTSSPFEEYSTLYQGIDSAFPQSVGPEYLKPIDQATRLRMTPHHALNPPTPGFIQPIQPYQPKSVVPGFPEPIGPPPSQPMVYYYAERIFGPHSEAADSPPFQQMVPPQTGTNNSDFSQSAIPHGPQAIAAGEPQPQRIGSLGEMLSGTEEVPASALRRRSTITFNPNAIEFTPSPTAAGLANPGAAELALSPIDVEMAPYEASELTHNPADLGMIPYEETGVEGFIAPDANAEATIAEAVQDTYKKILAIEDERDREDALNEFYYMQAKPWTDEMTRLEKEEQELEERKRRFARKN